MLKLVAKNTVKNQLTFVSDKDDVSEQVQELQEIHVNEDVLPAAREHLNLSSPGVSDTARAYYDETTNSLLAGPPAGPGLPTIRQARTLSFSSLMD